MHMVFPLIRTPADANLLTLPAAKGLVRRRELVRVMESQEAKSQDLHYVIIKQPLTL